MTNSPLGFSFSFLSKSKNNAYASLKQVMWKNNSGLTELCTNMKRRLGNKAVIKFSYSLQIYHAYQCFHYEWNLNHLHASMNVQILSHVIFLFLHLPYLWWLQYAYFTGNSCYIISTVYSISKQWPQLHFIKVFFLSLFSFLFFKTGSSMPLILSINCSYFSIYILLFI